MAEPSPSGGAAAGLGSVPAKAPDGGSTSAFDRYLIQCRDLFSMRAHHGWLHFLIQKLGQIFRSAPAARQWEARLGRRSDERTRAFDRKHGTDTFRRAWIPCGKSGNGSETTWGYSPINQDFFREIMRSVHVPRGTFTFIDVGCGKGAAVMLASEFGFRRYLGIEISEELVATAAGNFEKYRQSTGRAFRPELIRTDFMEWSIPPEDALFFLNNPFPPDLSLRALFRIEASLSEGPRRVLLVYRKAPANVGAHLHASTVWRPLRLAPYWRIYTSPMLSRELATERRRRTAR